MCGWMCGWMRYICDEWDIYVIDEIYMWYMFVWIYVMMECKKNLKIVILGHFAECCTRQRTPLPSAMVTTLDKAGKMGARKTIFLALPSAMVTALGKAGKMVFWTPIFPALPSAVTIALGKGVLCRVQHSAKWPKTANFNFFYITLWQINSYNHISHIYLIHHIYISSIHTSIRTYHIHHNIY